MLKKIKQETAFEFQMKTLTYEEAFMAMQNFLEKYYKETKSDGVGSLLGEFSFDIWEGGLTETLRVGVNGFSV